MRAILFDWDGTIVDSIQALFETDAAICRQIGVPFDESIFRRTFSPNWRLMYRALGIPEDRTEEAVRVWAAMFHSDRTQPFPGVEGALARLAAAGHRLGIVTGGGRAEVEPQLSRLGLDELLTVRVYGHDTAAGKPDPRPLQLALELAGDVRPEDAVYVGDALDDMRMAAAAEVRGIGIVSMLATAEELVAAGAVESAGSVVEWVDRLLAAPRPGRPALRIRHASPRPAQPAAASLLDMSAMPKVGEFAPDFELRDDEGKAHRLSDRRGHFTVVYFYPADDTPGCTKEACSFRDNNAAFRDADTEVWGLSPQGPASKAAFRAKYGLPFTLLADEDHAVAESFGAWGEKVNYGKTYWGIVRSSFLVGPDGRIAYVWPKVKPEDHAVEVLAALRSVGATPA